MDSFWTQSLNVKRTLRIARNMKVRTESVYLAIKDIIYTTTTAFNVRQTTARSVTQSPNVSNAELECFLTQSLKNVKVVQQTVFIV